MCPFTSDEETESVGNADNHSDYLFPIVNL